LVGNQPHRLTQSPISYVGLEMSTGQKCSDALRLRVKAEWLIPFVDKRAGGR